MFSVYKDKADCCGCSTCAQICPQNAIMMQEDEQLFLYPTIDYSKCVYCGLCKERCAFSNQELNKSLRTGEEKPNVYAAYAKKGILDSTSGGMATVLAETIIESGGVVYGVKWSGDCRKASHDRVTDKKGLDAFKTSKYVQSDKGDMFSRVRLDLSKGLRVLFIGTPCEVAGLKSFLGDKRQRLTTISLICHAAASRKYLGIVLTSIEAKHNSKLVSLNMRYKENGKVAYSVKFGFADKTELVLSEEQFHFHAAFLGSYIIRQCCCECKFKGFPQISDITLGDYWGLSEKHPGFNRAGVNVVLINTVKGEELFEQASDKFASYRGDLDELIKSNPRLTVSTPPPPRVLKLAELEKKYGISGALKKIAETTARREKCIWKTKLKSKAKSIVKQVLRI